MLQKESKGNWKSYLKKGLGTVIVLEGAFIASTYYVWFRLNRERDFRFYMRNSYPLILESFYSVGERLNSEYRTRDSDLKIWTQEGKISN